MRAIVMAYATYIFTAVKPTPQNSSLERSSANSH